MTTAPKDAEPSTRAANAALRAVLPFEDRRDFEDTRRGLIATLPDGVARAASGQIVWNLSDYEFLAAEEAPATVNPSLWRMAQLNRVSGLFQPCDDAQRSRCRASTQYSRDPAQGGGARRHLRRTTRIKAAYSGHYERLVALRNKYDPTNLFRLNQNIRPTL